MDKFFAALFNALGKQYEVQVYERSRRNDVAGRRGVLGLLHEPDTVRDARLDREIKLTERLLAALAEHKDNEI